MSTPSTATALPPLNHYQYGHSQNHYPHHSHHPHRPVLLSSHSHLSNSSPATSPVMSSKASQASKRNVRRERNPNWEEFYKNGVPQEIIIIEDTPPPQSGSSTASGRGRQQQPTISSSSRVAATNGYQGSVGNSQIPRHADKKRKVSGQSAAEPIYPSQHHSPYSSTQTPIAAPGYSPTTVSADSPSVTGNSTTAGTSLGSVGVSSANHAITTVVNGQKRKRVTRASQAAAAAANAGLDAFASYHPPPRPPIKAKEVYVQSVPDLNRNQQGRVDDDDGHYIVNSDTDLTTRYRITKLLGQGTFGKVVEAYDRTKRTKCAIKIIRSVQKYRDASRIELRVLSTLSCNDNLNLNKCIHLRDCFDYRNHICIVTDLLGMSVFDFLKGNTFAPFPNSHIQSFARQLLTSVAFLHDLDLIHTDLKPENILLVHNQYQTFNYNRVIPSSSTTTSRQGRTRRVLLDTDIRLIDFGSATFNDEYHSSVVSTRHYRAPEIILGLAWSFPCDIWSIGCILVEFYTGDALFQTHDNLEHLAMMQAVCGVKFDTKLIRTVAARTSGVNTTNALKYFRGSKLDYPNNETTRASRKYVTAMKGLIDIIPARDNFHKHFLDLLKRIFVYDPSKRITAKEALKHQWFRESVIDEGTEAVKIKLEKEAAAAAAAVVAQTQAQSPSYTR